MQSIERRPTAESNLDLCTSMIFEGCHLTIAGLQKFYLNLIEETKELLYNDILHGAPLPDVHQQEIFDNIICTTPGYSMFTNPWNPFHHHTKFLLELLMQLSDEFCYHSKTNQDSVIWNVPNVQKLHAWFKRLGGKLFVLMQVSNRQPGRGPELSTITWHNTGSVPRNIYWICKKLNVICFYNKSQMGTQLEKLILCAFEPVASKLWIDFGTFMVPAMTTIYSLTCSTFSSDTIYQYPFSSTNGLWTTADFSATLAALTGPPEHEGRLGIALTIALLCHIMIAIIRCYCQTDTQVVVRFMKEIQCLQVGHGKEASAGYAVTANSCRNMSMHHLIAMQELSIIHHRIISPSTAPTLTAIKPHPSGTLILSNPNKSISKHMEQFIICQFSSLAADLRIQIPQAVASGMAATFLSHLPSELEISSNTDGPTWYQEP